jgi:hypothetical protein
MSAQARDEFDTVLSAVDHIEAELARELLESAGIPSLLHSPDFDIAELGIASHGQMRLGDLLVPRGAQSAARATLVAAWGEDAVARHDPRA